MPEFRSTAGEEGANTPKCPKCRDYGLRPTKDGYVCNICGSTLIEETIYLKRQMRKIKPLGKRKE